MGGGGKMVCVGEGGEHEGVKMNAGCGGGGKSSHQ